MADQDMLHAAELLKAAMPFVDPRTKVMAEMFTKLMDLMGTFKSFANMNLAACGFEGKKPDFEGLLNGIRPLCSGKEREWVDRILNIFNMKRMFEMYNNMMSTMKTMQEFGGFNFNDSGNGMNTESVMGNFSGMNFESIFSMFNGSSNPGASGVDNSSGSSDDTPNDSSAGFSDAYEGFNNDSASGSFDANAFIHDNTSESFDAHAFIHDNASESFDANAFFSDNASGSSDAQEAFNNNTTGFFDTSSGTDHNPNSGSSDTTEKQSKQAGNPGMNGMMFEMLKNMVPPEQMSTFENLSMLFNTMSYDNNSKPNVSEEHKNG